MGVCRFGTYGLLLPFPPPLSPHLLPLLHTEEKEERERRKEGELEHRGPKIRILYISSGSIRLTVLPFTEIITDTTTLHLRYKL